MPQVNRKSALGHWYAPVSAPEYPRDLPESHGCTLFERCKGCPYPGHGFICWQSEDWARLDGLNIGEAAQFQTMVPQDRCPCGHISVGAVK